MRELRLSRKSRWGLVISMALLAGCTRKPAPEEAARLLEKQGANNYLVSQYRCRDGEKQWDFVCDVWHVPTELGIRQSLRPLAGRVGITIGGMYKGEPLFSASNLPSDGPIPSRDEYATWLRRVNAEAEAKHQANANRRSPQ
jgi:hypothetical protein